MIFNTVSGKDVTAGKEKDHQLFLRPHSRPLLRSLATPAGVFCCGLESVTSSGPSHRGLVLLSQKPATPCTVGHGCERQGALCPPPGSLSPPCENPRRRAQPCLSLCDPTDCSPAGSCIHRDSPGKNAGWVAISSSRGSSRPRDRTHLSASPALRKRLTILYL